MRRAIAAIAAATVIATGLITNDLASAYQDRDSLAHKRAVAARVTDCTLYGSGCLGDWTGYQHGIDGDPATADVLVVGDSIVTRCRPYLRKRLTAYGLTSVFDYWSSRPTTPAVDRLLSYSRLSQPNTFRAVAMATGTNDVMDPSVMTAQINRAKTITPPVLWGTVYTARSGTYSADLRNTGWVNLQIGASGLPLVDWFTFLASYPGYRIGAYLTSDGVHPTYDTTDPQTGDGTGCDAWAKLYADKIATVA